MAQTILDAHRAAYTLGVTDHGSKLGVMWIDHCLPAI
eukprot:CAMPEP_0197448716 /NCGR_PEP_ID=MMETSP1175-20131217/18650_1 /TAXON_ID=1003142 /ORGANISM="Triceratium dubium, Strain CCMP147" /LENGTH=36 /DNA_ID= /DNA_START= /DNA_END= /DNA_ORIENTATION=